MTFVPSKFQQAIFDAVTNPNAGSIIVDAKAGSGKTTTIIEAAKLMQGSIFLGAYNKKMADELSVRCKTIPNVKAATFHSAGYQAIRNEKPALGAPSNKMYYLVKSFIDSNYEHQAYAKAAWQIASIVSMGKQRGIGAILPDTRDNWEELIVSFGLLEGIPGGFDSRSDLFNIIKISQAVLEYDISHLRSIDFDDMVYLPLRLNLKLPTYDWVMIDEAQDTNPVRRELAKRMLKPNGRMLVVGDPNQAIYGFTGADNDALDQLRKDLNASTLPLSETYRCPKNVVSLAKTYVPGITSHPNADDGEVASIYYDELTSIAKPGEVILSRYNRYLLNLCFKFIQAEKPVKIEGQEIATNLKDLLNKWKTENLNDLIRYVEKWSVKQTETAKLNGGRTDGIRDRADTAIMLIKRAQSQKLNSKAALFKMLDDLFTDDVKGNADKILLCSVHRSKGMEWDTVYLLGRSEIMGKACAKQWQTDQEKNLIYVGITRAKKKFVDVINIPSKL